MSLAGYYSELFADLKSGQEATPEKFDIYLQSTVSEPDFIPSYRNMGTIATEAQQYDNAFAHLSKAEKIDPFNDDLQNSIGWMNYLRGIDTKKMRWMRVAKKHLTQAIRLNPTNYRAYNNLGLVYRDGFGYNSTAIRYFKKSIKNNHPQLYKPYMNMGVAYSYKKDYKNAEKYLLKSMSDNLENFVALRRLLEIEHEQGAVNLEDPFFVETYTKDIDWDDPGVMRLYYLLGSVYLKNKQIDKAINILELAKKADSQNKDIEDLLEDARSQ